MTTRIRVFGPGCDRCKALAENAKEAVAAIDLDATVEEVHDPIQMAVMGILATPALVIDEELVVAGHVATVPQIREVLSSVATGSIWRRLDP